MSDKIRDGREALRLLETPVFRKALDAVKDEVAEMWMRESDAEKREEYWHEQRVLARVVKRLQHAVEVAEVEEMQSREETHDPRLGDASAAEHTEG